jgi:hypothetical protein
VIAKKRLTRRIATSGTTSYKQDDFLKLDLVAGKPTESFGDNQTGVKGESSLPILPLNPDAASMGAGSTTITSSSSTGVTDKAGADHVWKPTALDEVKPEGAPGAGPAPPANVTPATGDLSTATTSKTDEPTVRDTPSSAIATTPAPKESSSSPAPKEPAVHSVGSDIDKILESQPKSQHTVNDSEASDPHSKMTGKTVRQTEPSQQGESANSKSTWTQQFGNTVNTAYDVPGLATEKTGNRSASHGSGDAGDDNEGKKLSTKEKLKQKLHIGHKDK